MMDAWNVIAGGTNGTGRPVISEPNSEAREFEIKSPGPEGERNPSESSSAAAGADVVSLVPPPPKAVKTLLEGDLLVYLEEVLQCPCFDLFIGHVGASLVRTDGADPQQTPVPYVCVSLQVLGTGCAGTRCLAGWHAGMPVAVKELLRAITGDDMQREMAILRTVTHKNVVRYYTHASDASYHYLVLERCDCSLEQAVLVRGPGDFPGPMVEGPARTPTAMCMAVAMGMVEGLVELHRVGVVHRDLKPSNILLSRDGGSGGQAPVVAKIADLGLGKAMGHGQSSFMSSRAGGTQCWQAPEQIQPPPGALCSLRPAHPFFCQCAVWLRVPPWLHFILNRPHPGLPYAHSRPYPHCMSRPYGTRICRWEVPGAPGRLPAGVLAALLLHGRAASIWAGCVPADIQHNAGAARPSSSGPPPGAPGSGGEDAGNGTVLCPPGCRAEPLLLKHGYCKCC